MVSDHFQTDIIYIKSVQEIQDYLNTPKIKTLYMIKFFVN